MTFLLGRPQFAALLLGSGLVLASGARVGVAGTLTSDPPAVGGVAEAGMAKPGALPGGSSCVIEVWERHRFGSLDGPDALSRVGRLFLDVRGDEPLVFILLPQERQVRAFTERGDPRLRLGRQGMGPGEFRSPTGTGAVGDRVWVWDGEVGRLSFFGPDGRPQSSLRLEPGDGAFALEGGIVVRRPRIAGRQPTFDVAFERVREGDGAVIDTVAVLRYDQPVLRIQSGPITSSFAQPFIDIPFTFSASNSAGFAIVHRRLEDRGQGPVLHGRVWSADGSAQELQVPMQPEEISARQVDSVLTTLSAGIVAGARNSGAPVDARDFAPARFRHALRIPRW